MNMWVIFHPLRAAKGVGGSVMFLCVFVGFCNLPAGVNRRCLGSQPVQKSFINGVADWRSSGSEGKRTLHRDDNLVIDWEPVFYQLHAIFLIDRLRPRRLALGLTRV